MPRTALIRLASALPQGSQDRQALLRMAKEFSTPEAFKEYLKEHPNADKSKHTVKQDGGGSSKKDEKKKPLKKEVDEAIKGPPNLLDIDEKDFGDNTRVSDSDIKKFEGNPVIRDLGDFNLRIIAGEDGVITRGDLRRALHVAAVLAKGISSATDFCKINEAACKGNLGITRDNMPQVMDKPIRKLLDAMSEEEYDKLDAEIKKSGQALKDAIPDKKKRKAYLDRRKGLAAVAAGADPDENPQTKWFKTLKENGVDVTDDEIPVGELIASQAEIKADKSYNIAKAFLTGEFEKLPELPILVARDPKTGKATVIDGHHRYAGLLLSDPTRKMKAKVIEAPIQEALSMAFDVPGVFRADLQDDIIDPDKPLDLARKPGDTWQQKNKKWYAKNSEGKTGGPFKDKGAASDFAGSKKNEKKGALIRLASNLPKGSQDRRTLLKMAQGS